MLKNYLALWVGFLWLSSVYADDAVVVAPEWPELALISEHAVDDMPDSNLSGIAECSDGLWVESDRSDLQIYKLLPQKDNTALRAEALTFDPPSVPKNAMPLLNNLGSAALGILRGGAYDFEGISCDAVGNKYLVSEAYLAVLKLPINAQQPSWLVLPDMLWQQARAQGLLQKTNQLLEGLAISPDGKRLWLAAERNKRGLLALTYDEEKGWQCPNGQCVLLAEGGKEAFPPQFRRKNRIDARDFADLAFYKGKLFTLERGAFRICRRDLTAKVEQCWSFAKEALQPHRQYYSYGMPEALWIDDKGAWIGIDNDMANKRIDGESRPIVWRFAAPLQGWLATTGTMKNE